MDTGDLISLVVAVTGFVGSMYAINKERKSQQETLGVRQLELALATQQAQLDRQDAQIQAKDARIEAQGAKLEQYHSEVAQLRREVAACHQEKLEMRAELEMFKGRS